MVSSGVKIVDATTASPEAMTSEGEKMVGTPKSPMISTEKPIDGSTSEPDVIIRFVTTFVPDPDTTTPEVSFEQASSLASSLNLVMELSSLELQPHHWKISQLNHQAKHL
ncbi:unnamed protein product [Pleuronectes platessa]|uniref:Uncharacterized protein n=1 Tax=Pleuronectes platessa TaxID=8262 RepID=A0A9N7VEC1_PLEPL|nr:unnamed protein product [Pleuronectes platessa]